jgi:hypothetical protein
VLAAVREIRIPEEEGDARTLALNALEPEILGRGGVAMTKERREDETRASRTAKLGALPMVRHILLLQPRPESSPEAIEACRLAITGLVGRIPGLIDCHWGENFGPAARTEGLTLGFSMDFADRASLDAYGPHPDHRAAAELVLAAFARVVVFDFALGG